MTQVITNVGRNSEFRKTEELFNSLGRLCFAEGSVASCTAASSMAVRTRNRTPSASPAFRQAGMTLTIQFPSTSENFDNRITCYCLYAYCLLSYCYFDFDEEIYLG